MEYDNIDLLFDRIGENYKVRIINSPGGQAEYKFKKPFSNNELDEFLSKISNAKGSFQSSHLGEIKSFGAKLFETVFCKDVRVCFERSIDHAENIGKGLRLRLHLTHTPELADLPWEYIYKSSLNRFFSLSIETPIIRYLDLPERIPTLHVTTPLKILVMISSPEDFPALNTESELNKLTSALKDLIDQNLVVMDFMENSTIHVLHQRLRNESYQIFHYIGHGAFDTANRDGVLVFENERNRSNLISGEQLGMILKDHNSMRLVVLNACEGARASIEDPFSGIAQSLVQQGIPAVIAMQFEVSDYAAVKLSQEFYSFIALGYPVDEALAETRKSIRVSGNPVEWGIPVLYMRSPDGCLFDLPKKDKDQSVTVKTTKALSDSGQTGISDRRKYNENFKLELHTAHIFSRHKIKRFWFPLSVIFLFTVIIIGMLSKLKVTSTQVELNLEVSEFSFRIQEDWDMASLAASTISITNLGDLSLEIVSAEQVTNFDPETDKPLEWQPFEAGEQFNIHGKHNWSFTVESDYLSLTNMFIAAGALVHISRNDNQNNQISINIREGSVVGNINTGDTLILNCQNCDIINNEDINDDDSNFYRLGMFDNQIQFKDMDQVIRIQMDFVPKVSENTSIELGEFIPVQTINFTKMNSDKIESTIVHDGFARFTDLNNEMLVIHEGDFVFLNELQQFQIKKIKLTDNLKISIHGKAVEVEIGAGSLLNSYVPSWLEWLYANQSIVLFIATLIPVLSIIFVVLRQLKIIDKN